MKEKIITEIINEMLPALNNGQLKKIERCIRGKSI